MDAEERPAGIAAARPLFPMLRRFLLTAAIGFAALLAWEFAFDDAVHGILRLQPDSAAGHWRFVLYETLAVAAVAVLYSLRLPAELAAKEAVAKCQALMQGANDAILIADTEGNFIDANPRAERLLGRGRDELLKISFRQIYPPESLDEAEAAFNKMLGSGFTRHTDAIVVRSDGERVPVDVAASVVTINGQKRVLGIFRDMSLLADKRRQLHLFETAINRAGEMIVITDRAGTIQYANSATKTITGYDPAELPGKHIRLFKSGQHRPELYATMWNTLLKGGIWKGDLVNRHAKGHNYEVQVTISPIFGRAGEITHFVSIQHDITERKRLTEQVLHADKLSSIGSFMAGVAHELNNPLTVVVGYANDLAGDPELPPRLAAPAQNIRDQANRAVEVVRNLLAYSRPHRGEKAVYDLGAIIRQTVAIHQYRIQMDGIQVNFAPPANPMNIEVSAGQVQQVLVNLIVNAHAAIKSARKPGGNISITAARKEGWGEDFFETVVSDDGPSIPPEKLTRIFDPYYTTKKAGEGTGLGLYICARIVYEHGGDIWAENQPGGGVAFHFTLPASARPAPAPPPEAGPAKTGAGAAGARVLVVEDEPLVRTVISKTLLAHEVFPVQAANGKEAARLLAEGTFDAILCDYKMPEMNGLELYRWLEKNRPEYVPRFVFHTGALEKDLLDFCGGRGIAAVIKPAEPEALVEAVEAVIGGGKGGGHGA